MEQQNQNLFDLQIDQQTFNYFSESAKWGKFLAIVGFVFCAIILLFAFFAGALLATMVPMMGGGMDGSSVVGGVGGLMSIYYLVIGLIYFFPCLYLYRYSSQMQLAIKHNEQIRLQNSIKNLKSLFKFLGIVTIVMLAFVVLGLFIAVVIVGVGGAMS